MTYEMPEISSIDWSKLKIAIVGGDEREQEIARLVVETGANVSVFGFPMDEHGLDGATRTKTASESIKDADFILFPIPGMSQDGALFSNEKIYPNEAMLSGAKNDAHLIMGLPHPDLTEVCRKLGFGLHEYETDKELMLLRMPSIVELALKIIIENTKVSIHGSSVVVVGQGNVAHTLTRDLVLLGANVTVAARNPVQRAEAIVIGAKAITLDVLGDAVANCDICLSAVPAPLVTRAIIDRMPKSVFIADFAAPPGGVDFEYARSKNINCVWGRGLGRRAPITVGRSQWKGIAERIISIVKERK
ncbi:MAG: dipicolinate synthase subunit DpsA [Pseudomonadota bacterium]|nr:dipicolinate synthase subunit DpsA [Pseudomonadota bacterium]